MHACALVQGLTKGLPGFFNRVFLAMDWAANESMIIVTPGRRSGSLKFSPQLLATCRTRVLGRYGVLGTRADAVAYTHRKVIGMRLAFDWCEWDHYVAMLWTRTEPMFECTLLFTRRTSTLPNGRCVASRATTVLGPGRAHESD